MEQLKKIVVTGATGMIGAAVVRNALAHGIFVVCIVHKGSLRLDNIPHSDKISLIYADLSDYKDYQPEIADCDAFIHFAWEKTSASNRDETDSQAHNILYTLDAVRLAARFGCKVFIGAGSQAEYGPATDRLGDDTPLNPESGYGIAKYAAGKLSSLLCSQLGIRYNWMRILSVYGPFDGKNTLISYVFQQLQQEKSPELTKCEQIWDYLYCDDAARAFLAVAFKGQPGKAYVLGSGNERPLSAYVEVIGKIVAPNVPIRYGVKAYYPHQPMFLVADISSLKKDVGWGPEVSFEEGVEKLYIWNQTKERK